MPFKNCAWMSVLNVAKSNVAIQRNAYERERKKEWNITQRKRKKTHITNTTAKSKWNGICGLKFIDCNVHCICEVYREWDIFGMCIRVVRFLCFANGNAGCNFPDRFRHAVLRYKKDIFMLQKCFRSMEPISMDILPEYHIWSYIIAMNYCFVAIIHTFWDVALSVNCLKPVCRRRGVDRNSKNRMLKQFSFDISVDISIMMFSREKFNKNEQTNAPL